MAEEHESGKRLQWEEHGTWVVRAMTWSARLVGLIALTAVFVPVGRRKIHPELSEWLGIPESTTRAAMFLTVVLGCALLMLAAGLRRRKRRAWQIAVILSAILAMSHLVSHHGFVAASASLALFVALIATRKNFTAFPDPAMGKWRAIVVFLEVLGAGVLVNFLAMAAAPQRVMDYPSLWERFSESILALIGVSGPITFHIAVLDNAVTTIGLLFGVGALAIGGYFLLRSAEPTPGLSQDEEHRIRVFLDKHGHRDSLGYFALRRDKSIVFSASGKSAVTYRVLAGVALSAGDPLGDPEAWPGAIEVFLEKCTQHAWTPAVLGCSEQAATIWSRHNLDALELGDEAIVDTEKFSLEGRPMRGVRQAVNRVRRAGYEVQVRRAKDIPDAEHKELAKLAEKWRGEATERGFSMAISRLADHTDPECVLVTATHEGKVAGMLQFVPWGIKGLSLDMMRRDRAADNGLNELMITETLTRSKEIGVTEVSLNFAFFRAALERGEKIGAGYVSRLMASILKIASRWWQIETLYKFNAKFQPEWVPRYMVFPALRDVPRIAIASMEAEGFGGRPPKLLRMLRR